MFEASRGLVYKVVDRSHLYYVKVQREKEVLMQKP